MEVPVISYIAWLRRRGRDDPFDPDKPLIDRDEDGRVRWTKFHEFLQRNHLAEDLRVEIYPRSMKHRYVLGMLHGWQRQHTITITSKSVMWDKEQRRIQAGPWRRRLVFYFDPEKRPAAGTYRIHPTGFMEKLGG